MAFLEFKNVRIAGIAAGVPRNTISNYTLKQGVDISSDYTPEAFVETTGVKERRVDDRLTTSDLCVQAAERLISDLGWEKASIEALIFVSIAILLIIIPIDSFGRAFVRIVGLGGLIIGLVMVAVEIVVGKRTSADHEEEVDITQKMDPQTAAETQTDSDSDSDSDDD